MKNALIVASSNVQCAGERVGIAPRGTSTPLVTVSLCLGAVLIILCGAMAAIGPSFDYGNDHTERPYLSLVSLLVAAGIVYLVTVFLWVKRERGFPPFIWVVTIGLLMRGLMIFSVPIQEDDFYRYLWDGAVTAHGYNPFAYIPADVYALSDAPQTLKTLADDSGDVVQRINHPDLATIYPTLAQGAFVVAYWLKPWSLLAWRTVLLVFDGATLALLVVLLRRLGKPIGLAAIYWWNPLVVKEIFNSAHMDGLILPFVLAALLFAMRGSPMRVGIALVLAVYVKVWPVILAPIALGAFKSKMKDNVRAGLVSLVLVFVLCLPLLASIRLGEKSGFFAYSERWEMNDAAFMVIAKVTEIFTMIIGMGDRAGFADVLARLMVLAIVGTIVIAMSWRPPQNNQEICHRFALAVGALFLLSPTQFPWYYIWMTPLLALSPRPSLLVMTLTLPLYYLRFFLAQHDYVSLFHHGVVWIEYAPVGALLLWEWKSRWGAQPEPGSA